LGTAVVPKEPEEAAPDSPRTSVARYLEACRKGDYKEAAHYLDVPSNLAGRAPELAQELYVVLNRNLTVDADLLDGTAQGRGDDGLPPGTDELGRFHDKAQRIVSVRIVHTDSKGDPRWVFSQPTVQHVDEWYDALGDRWLRAHLPSFLQREGPESLLIWQWLALPVVLAAAYLAGRMAAFVAGGLFRRVAKKRGKSWLERVLRSARGPFVMAVTLVGVAFVLPHLSLYLAAETFVSRVVRAAGLAAFFWALVRGAVIFGESLEERQGGKPSWVALTQLGQKATRIVIIVLGSVAVLSELGYPVASLIAGLGIGGIALALAAQKTVENLFGSASILADQPFRAGEAIRVDGIEGTVELIGLRSTRIRTAERTLVIIPNGKLADMRIEAFAARDRFRFSTRLGLTPSTPRKSVEALLSALRAVLEDEKKVRREERLVFVKGLSEAALEVELSAYLEVDNFSAFVDLRGKLLLAILDALAQAGVSLATPPAAPAPPQPAPAAS
jgi:MscS family membrane protein